MILDYNDLEIIDNNVNTNYHSFKQSNCHCDNDYKERIEKYLDTLESMITYTIHLGSELYDSINKDILKHKQNNNTTQTQL
jgi:hypothetical protein